LKVGMWLKDLIVTGGPSMFVVLLIGLIALLTAGWFAWRVEGRVRGFLDGMGRAVLYAALAAVAIDVSKVLGFAYQKPPTERTEILMSGLAESISPLILGFALLALIHFLTAIGQRRLDGRRS
jgi:hypothetical protein